MGKTIEKICEAIKEMNKLHPGKVDAQEVIKCPSCGGKLYMHKNSYNGHVWGRCETENCLTWMQQF